MIHPKPISRTFTDQSTFAYPFWVKNTIKVTARFLSPYLNTPTSAGFSSCVTDIVFFHPFCDILKKSLTTSTQTNGEIRSFLVGSILAKRNPAITINNAAHKMTFKIFWQSLWPSYGKAFVWRQAHISQEVCDINRSKIGAKMRPFIFKPDIICTCKKINKLNQIGIFAANLYRVLVKIAVTPNYSENPSQFIGPFKKEFFVWFVSVMIGNFTALFSSSVNCARAHWLAIFNFWSTHIFMIQVHCGKVY